LVIARSALVTVGFLLVSAFAMSSPAATVSQRSNTTAPPRATGNPEADLRAAARTWVKAFLYGTPQDIRSLQGPECVSPPRFTDKEQRAYLKGVRAVMRNVLGRRLADIEIVDIELRSVTPTSGEAQVVYNLPVKKVGNDNWVEYRVHDGRWLIANCHAPLGGHSTSATAPSR